MNLFRKPYRGVESPKDKVVSILVFGQFIFLFLFLFKPFGLSGLKTLQSLYVTFGFGLVTTFMLFVFKYLLEPIITRGNWTLGKNILWDIAIASSIGAANYCYICLIFPQPFEIKYLFFSVWSAILVGSIPVTISYFITLNRIYKNALKEAFITPEDVFWEGEVTIRAGNPKNELVLNPRSIVYLCSNDNYVTIVTIKGDVLNKTTIRGTLKSAEKELAKNSMFMRCHKCFIVNLDFVERVTGHNQNMKIRLIPSSTEIPVSREKAEIVLKRTNKV